MSVATNTAPPAGSGEKNEGKPSTRPNPVALEAAVTVTGARPSSEGTRDLFTEETRTILVFVDGAVIQLAAGVAVGQLLFLTHQKTKEEVVCQILQKRVFRPTVCYVEVQFTEDKPNFWGVSFAKEPAGPVEFKVAEQVAAQETTEDDHGAGVAPKSEQEIDELKRQVDSLRQQLQELENRKALEPAAREGAPAPVLASPNAAGTAASGTGSLRPVHATGDEALLMPTAAPAEKKAPRWAVPMALPGWGKAEAEAPGERDPSEELLPKPELDFSHLPSAVYAEESDPRSIYKPKGIPPHKVRQMALAIALMGVLGVAAYARVWTALPLLKTAVAAVVQQAENAVSKRGSAKANAPVPAAALTKTVATGAVVSTKNAGDSAGQPAQPGGAVATKADAVPAAARETATKRAPSDVAASSTRPLEEKPEKSIRRNGRSQAVAPVEAKAPQAVAPDGPVLAPTLIHAAAPVYPPDAMLNYITGDVRAELVVEADGRVGDVKVISGPKALRDAAIEALKKYEYAPGTQGGRPTAVKTTATVKFWFNP